MSDAETDHPEANDEDDLEATNHLLGLLDPRREAAARARIRNDVDFAARVALWAERFDALDDAPLTAPTAPALWDAIERAVADTEAVPGTETRRADAGVWEELGEGLARRVLFVDRTAGVQSYYIRMRSGAVLPLHDHRAVEQCVLVSGRLRIGEVEFGPGDFHIAFAGEEHRPIHAIDDSVFFIHSALEAPLA